MTEIDKLKNNSSISIFLNGDLMQFVFDDDMKMTFSIFPENLNICELMFAMLRDATDEIGTLS